MGNNSFNKVKKVLQILSCCPYVLNMTLCTYEPCKRTFEVIIKTCGLIFNF